MARAEAVLQGTDETARQLSDRQRSAVVRALRWRTLHRLLLGVGGFPFLLWAAIGLYVAATAEQGVAVVAFPISLSPILIYAAVGLVAYGVATSARNRLLGACAAGPPRAPGEPAECHVCGGPVASSGIDSFARCAYCGTDNVVHPVALAAARGRHDRDVSTLEADVLARSRAASSASFGAATVAIVSLLITPFAALIGSLTVIVAVAWVFSEIGLEPLPHK